jgi:putative transposase
VLKKTRSLYRGHRFPAVVVSCAVRWYCRFNLSLQDFEVLLLERGVVVTYETIRCRYDKFGAGFAQRAKAARHRPGSTWHRDEMFVTLRREPYRLWRAVDEYGIELDVLVPKRRDKAAATRLFWRVRGSNPVPREIVTRPARRRRLTFPASFI